MFYKKNVLRKPLTINVIPDDTCNVIPKVRVKQVLNTRFIYSNTKKTHTTTKSSA